MTLYFFKNPIIINRFICVFLAERCLADFYMVYLDALGHRGAFYRRPLAVGIRYGEQVLGINKIKGLMKEITGKAGLVGNFTNHSGKRTSATQLYQAGWMNKRS